MLNRSLLCCLALVTICPGCGPQIDPEELGEVIYEIPEVPAATTAPHRRSRADAPPQTPPPRSGPARR